MQYQFWLYNPAATPAWSQLQAYSAQATCAWTPAAAGNYLLSVTAQDATGTAVNTTALVYRHQHPPLTAVVRHRLARLAATGQYADHLHRDRDGRHERAVPVLAV